MSFQSLHDLVFMGFKIITPAALATKASSTYVVTVLRTAFWAMSELPPGLPLLRETITYLFSVGTISCSSEIAEFPKIVRNHFLTHRRVCT